MHEDEIKMWKKFKRTKSLSLREEIVKKYLYLVKYVAGRVAIGLPPNVEFNSGSVDRTLAPQATLSAKALKVGCVSA